MGEGGKSLGTMYFPRLNTGKRGEVVKERGKYGGR